MTDIITSTTSLTNTNESIIRYTFYLDFSQSFVTSSPKYFVSSPFSVKQFMGSANEYQENKVVDLIYNSTSCPYNYFQKINVNDEANGPIWKKFQNKSKYTYCLQYTFNFSNPNSPYTYYQNGKKNATKVSPQDVLNLLNSISQFPYSTCVTNASILDLNTLNQNSAVSLVNDFCYYTKPYLNNATKFCTMAYQGTIPSILIEAANNNGNGTLAPSIKNTTFSNLYQKYMSITKTPNGYPISSYPEAKSIFMNYCSLNENWKSAECLDFYKNMYTTDENNSLDYDVQRLLFEKCNTSSNSETENKICACFQNYDVYKQYFEENNSKLPLKVFDNPKQCWFPSCFENLYNGEGVTPYKNYKCPSQTVCVGIINNNFKAGGQVKDNTIVNKMTIECGDTSNSSNSSNPSTSTSTPKTNPSQKKNNFTTKNIVFCSLLLIIIVFILVTLFRS